MDQPGKVAYPARGQLNRGKINGTLSPLAPENLVSRHAFSRPVPRQPAHFPHTGLIWCLLTGFLPNSVAAPIYLNRHKPSGQSRVYRAKQLFTDDVHCRESAGTGPVVFKVVPVTGAALQVSMDQQMYASLFPRTLLLVWSGHSMLKVSRQYDVLKRTR